MANPWEKEANYEWAKRIPPRLIGVSSTRLGSLPNLPNMTSLYVANRQVRKAHLPQSPKKHSSQADRPY